VPGSREARVGQAVEYGGVEQAFRSWAKSGELRGSAARPCSGASSHIAKRGRKLLMKRPCQRPAGCRFYGSELDTAGRWAPRCGRWAANRTERVALDFQHGLCGRNRRLSLKLPAIAARGSKLLRAGLPARLAAAVGPASRKVKPVSGQAARRTGLKDLLLMRNGAKPAMVFAEVRLSEWFMMVGATGRCRLARRL
jgi:hypothetical protein